jgi:subtilase family serine protease
VPTRDVKKIVMLSALIVSIVFLAALPSIATSVYAPTVTASSLTVQPAPIVTVQSSSNGPSCSSSLCPATVQKAYSIDALIDEGIDGKGQTVVIVDACGDSTIQSDLKTFDSQFKLSAPILNVLKPEGNPVSSCTGWTGETALDVEWAHVVAPGATIDLIITANAGAYAMYSAWSYALKNNLGNQLSNSWGGAGCSLKPCNNTLGEGIGPCTLTNGTQGVNVTNILANARKDHVTVLAAAGDSGAWGLGTTNEEPVPGDCNGVLTVGGTQLSVTSSGAYAGETAWEGSGGGYVSAPKEPEYQKSAGIPDSYYTLAKPDVAAVASCDSPVWVYVSGVWEGLCGTSVATPLWAGFMADVNQIRANNGFSAAGFVNPFLYRVIYPNSTLYANDFHDITSGNNGWSAMKGWDPVTGLGSFVASNLAGTLGDDQNA